MSWNHTTFSMFGQCVVDLAKSGYSVKSIEETGEEIDCRDLMNNTIKVHKALVSKDGEDFWLEEYLAIQDADCDGTSYTGAFLYSVGGERIVPKPEVVNA